MAENFGEIVQIIGPVIDVSFEKTGSNLPDIYEALEISKEDGSVLVIETEQHIGENTVRTIAMDSTDGLRRGMPVKATGSPIKMPVGEKVRGRLLNVVGDTIDGLPSIDKSDGYSIHSEAPLFKNLSTSSEVLYTGIKVIDLIEPYAKGGKLDYLVVPVLAKQF
jgi:F-type H+-transporting ATPase subunit beta